jgi:Precorrin-6x reductase CbiJ/CobK
VRILILGGTGEARELAAELVAAGTDVLSSLAGRVRQPRLPDGPVRIGGFGGADGLAAFLREESISHLIDATHPFAEAITANAALSAADACVPRLGAVPARVGDRPVLADGPRTSPSRQGSSGHGQARACSSLPAAATWTRSLSTTGTGSLSGQSIHARARAIAHDADPGPRSLYGGGGVDAAA